MQRWRIERRRGQQQTAWPGLKEGRPFIRRALPQDRPWSGNEVAFDAFSSKPLRTDAHTLHPWGATVGIRKLICRSEHALARQQGKCLATRPADYK